MVTWWLRWTWMPSVRCVPSEMHTNTMPKPLKYLRNMSRTSCAEAQCLRYGNPTNNYIAGLLPIWLKKATLLERWIWPNACELICFWICWRTKGSSSKKNDTRSTMEQQKTFNNKWLRLRPSYGEQNLRAMFPNHRSWLCRPNWQSCKKSTIKFWQRSNVKIRNWNPSST